MKWRKGTIPDVCCSQHLSCLEELGRLGHNGVLHDSADCQDSVAFDVVGGERQILKTALEAVADASEKRIFSDARFEGHNSQDIVVISRVTAVSQLLAHLSRPEDWSLVKRLLDTSNSLGSRPAV